MLILYYPLTFLSDKLFASDKQLLLRHHLMPQERADNHGTAVYRLHLSGVRTLPDLQNIQHRGTAHFFCPYQQHFHTDEALIPRPLTYT